MTYVDVVVIGAGASGLYCARLIAEQGRSVAVFDSGSKTARKVRIAGGGRCNFTNMDMTPERFLCGNPHFVKSALARFTPWDIIGFLAAHGLTYEEKAEGQLFCEQGGGAVAKALESAARSAGVRMFMGRTVTAVEKREDGFRLDVDGESFSAGVVVVATGGPSWPGVGASSFGLEVAKSFGLRVEPVRPALVSLVCGQWRYADIAGLSLPVAISCEGASFRDDLLFTHRGISGPAVLRISAYWRKGLALRVDFMPGEDVRSLLESAREDRGRTMVKTLLAERLPSRFVPRICGQFAFSQVGALSGADVDALHERLHAFEIIPTKTEGWDKAEIAAGGVDTARLSSKTMESRDVPGLYFIGEVLDVAGDLGGYNLHWAWASAAAAADAIIGD